MRCSLGVRNLPCHCEECVIGDITQLIVSHLVNIIQLK